MRTHGVGSGFGASLVVALLSASLAGCGSDGGGGGSGGSGNPNGCVVNSSFLGQPGTLWVEHKFDGVFTGFDTQDGKLLKTAAAPGYSPQVAGGNGLLWLINTDNNRDVTPFDPVSATALPALGFDANDTPVPASGIVWTVGVDSNQMINVYAISSPTSVKALSVNYVTTAYTAGSDGLYLLGGANPANLTELEVAYVDAADSQIVWRLTQADIPALQTWAADVGTTSMAVAGGKLFVKGTAPASDLMFAIDLATRAVVASGPLNLGSGISQLADLITDGVGVYAFDPGKKVLYEIDQTTLDAKRQLSLAVPDNESVFGVDSPIFAGAAWFGRLCGGNTYVRRVDLAAWTIADVLYPPGQGEAPQSYAYISP